MEIWKDIPGYEGLYQVSTLGRVKSLSRQNMSQRYHNKGYCVKEKILNTRKCGKQRNYYSVALFKDGVRVEHRVHRLVMLTFVGKSNLTVNHIDENTLNNTLSNLEYLSNADWSYLSSMQWNAKNLLVVLVGNSKEMKNHEHIEI